MGQNNTRQQRSVSVGMPQHNSRPPSALALKTAAAEEMRLREQRAPIQLPAASLPLSDRRRRAQQQQKGSSEATFQAEHRSVQLSRNEQNEDYLSEKVLDIDQQQQEFSATSYINQPRQQQQQQNISFQRQGDEQPPFQRQDSVRSKRAVSMVTTNNAPANTFSTAGVNNFLRPSSREKKELLNVADKQKRLALRTKNEAANQQQQQQQISELQYTQEQQGSEELVSSSTKIYQQSTMIQSFSRRPSSRERLQKIESQQQNRYDVGLSNSSLIQASPAAQLISNNKSLLENSTYQLQGIPGGDQSARPRTPSKRKIVVARDGKKDIDLSLIHNKDALQQRIDKSMHAASLNQQQQIVQTPQSVNTAIKQQPFIANSGTVKSSHNKNEVLREKRSFNDALPQNQFSSSKKTDSNKILLDNSQKQNSALAKSVVDKDVRSNQAENIYTLQQQPLIAEKQTKATEKQILVPEQKATALEKQEQQSVAKTPIQTPPDKKANQKKKIIIGELDFDTPKPTAGSVQQLKSAAKRDLVLADDYVFLDAALKNRYSVKSIRHGAEFERLQQRLQSLCTSSPFCEEFLITQNAFDTKTKRIYQRRGLLTLEQLVLERQRRGVKWHDREQDVQYIFDKLVRSVYLMYATQILLDTQAPYFNSALSPENIVFEVDSAERLHLKLVDVEYGTCAFERFQVWGGGDRRFAQGFPKSAFKRDGEDCLRFETSFDRLRFELFRVARIVYYIMLSSCPPEMASKFDCTDEQASIRQLEENLLILQKDYMKSMLKVLRTFLLPDAASTSYDLAYVEQLVKAQQTNNLSKGIIDKTNSSWKNVLRERQRDVSSQFTLEELVQELDICQQLKLFSRGEKLVSCIEALDIKKLHESVHDFQKILLQMARLFEIKFKYRKALEIYERCLEPICEVFGAHSLHVAHIHSTMGLLATKLGEYTRAEGSLTKALQIREQIVDASDEEDYCGYYQLLSESCQNLAQMYQESQRLEEAEKYYEKQIEIMQKLSAHDQLLATQVIVTVLNTLGAMWQNKPDLERAQYFFARCVKVQETVAHAQYDRAELANTCKNLALVCENKGEYKKAEKILLQSAQIYEKLDSPAYAQKLADVYQTLGRVCFALNDSKRADEFYQKKHELYTSTLNVGAHGQPLQEDSDTFF